MIKQLRASICSHPVPPDTSILCNSSWQDGVSSWHQLTSWDFIINFCSFIMCFMSSVSRLQRQQTRRYSGVVTPSQGLMFSGLCRHVMKTVDLPVHTHEHPSMQSNKEPSKSRKSRGWEDCLVGSACLE